MSKTYNIQHAVTVSIWLDVETKKYRLHMHDRPTAGLQHVLAIQKKRSTIDWPCKYLDRA